MTAPASVSIIICTRNRATMIGRSLAAVATSVEASPGVPAELIVVDNGSTDDTADVIAKWAAAQTFPVKIVNERAPGLSRARNAGLKVAENDIIAMTDDDCVVARDYVAQVAKAHAAAPEPSIIGGRVELGDPRDLPITLRTGLQREIYDRATRKPNGFIIGANLTFPRRLHETLGEFDTRFGAGAPFVASEDSDFVFRASLVGVPVTYDPDFAVSHFHGRRTLAEAQALQRGYSFGSGALYAKHFLKSREPASYVFRMIRDSIHERVHHGRSDPLIPNLHAFRLRHSLRGFATFLLHGRSRAPP